MNPHYVGTFPYTVSACKIARNDHLFRVCKQYVSNYRALYKLKILILCIPLCWRINSQINSRQKHTFIKVIS
jgi:hypothetical protein